MCAVKPSKKRPSAAAKNALLTACGQTGHAGSNMWLVFSGRNGARKVLSSDTEYLHFLAVEFDPEVRAFEVRPEAVRVEVDGAEVSVQFEAIVHFRDGRIECRQVRRNAPPPLPPGAETVESRAIAKAAAQRGAAFRLVSAGDLEPLGYRIQNSLRMLRFMASASTYTLGPLTNQVALVMRRENEMTLRQLMQELSQADQALVLAAAFGLLQRGTLAMDLDRDFVTFDSTIRRAAWAR